MFEARVIKNFTWSKRGDKLFKRGKKPITDLTKEDVDYLLNAGVITDVKEIGKKVEDKVEEVKEEVEKAVEKPKAEKAVKPRKTNKK